MGLVIGGLLANEIWGAKAKDTGKRLASQLSYLLSRIQRVRVVQLESVLSRWQGWKFIKTLNI